MYVAFKISDNGYSSFINKILLVVVEDTLKKMKIWVSFNLYVYQFMLQSPLLLLRHRLILGKSFLSFKCLLSDTFS